MAIPSSPKAAPLDAREPSPRPRIPERSIPPSNFSALNMISSTLFNLSNIPHHALITPDNLSFFCRFFQIFLRSNRIKQNGSGKISPKSGEGMAEKIMEELTKQT
jgi:hypothetical protein